MEDIACYVITVGCMVAADVAVQCNFPKGAGVQGSSPTDLMPAGNETAALPHCVPSCVPSHAWFASGVEVCLVLGVRALLCAACNW
jgi:hypothetical protein